MKQFLSVISVLAALSLAGCGSVISKGALVGVDRSADITGVQANPEAFTGRKVVWGGVILSTENLESTTEIECLETPLTYDDMPNEGASRGRFIIESKGFLDPNVFKPGLGITVAGTVTGAKTGKIGRMDYLYPVVTPLEIKTFDLTKQAQPPYPYPRPWIYDPFNPWRSPYDPFYDPFYDPYYPYRYYNPPPA